MIQLVLLQGGSQRIVALGIHLNETMPGTRAAYSLCTVGDLDADLARLEALMADWS